MSLVRTITEVEYPESDGLPMGETDLHRNWMMRLFDMLRYRYRDQRVYVACNLLVYHEEGEPSRFVVPDEFVVLDCEPGDRRVFKIWEEGKTPNVAIEITSRSTKNEDTAHKPELYARIGIKEFFLYDPTSEYMTPSLQGFRLQDDKYARIQPGSMGALECQQLGLRLQLKNGQLVILDSETGEPLRTHSEAAEARAAVAEEELRRLREQLKREDR
jgi:Uma2 family endonuclease